MKQSVATTIDQERVAQAARQLLEAIGEDADRPGLRDTPRRIAEAYAELFAGLYQDPLAVLGSGFEESHKEMVILKNIPFYSLCEHHLLPFHGRAHVGYVPEGRIAGASKIARVVDVFARRPQLQERLTSQVADDLQRQLDPLGVGVVIEAEHTCMSVRGARAEGAHTVTARLLGQLRENPATRAEFLALTRERGVR